MRVSKHIPTFLVLVYALLFLLTKSPSNPWDRVIASDGKWYYAYLTSLFIYHDTDYGYIDSYEAKYSPPGGLLYKDFRFDTGHGIVNKYFPGVAVLWLPFFALGHLAAWLTGSATDGYSMPYQIAIALAAFFYFWLALLLLRKVLRFYTRDKILIAWVLTTVALATNLVYYTVNTGSQVHVYNLFLITAFLYSIISALKYMRPIYLYAAAFLFGIILITRPQNGLIIFSVPFLCGDSKTFVRLLRNIFLHPRNLALCIAAISIHVSIPITYWFLKTGHFFIYSYGSEHYDFLRPHLWKFLFSFEKGWMIYTPVAAFSFLGLGYLYKTNKWQFFSLLVFLAGIVYVLSCWWVWTYTSFVSQRVMIDYYAFIALLLIFIFLWAGNTWKKNLVKLFLAILIGLNIMQYFQHLNWIYPAGPVTSKAYFANFFHFSRGSTFMIPEAGIESSQVYSDDFENRLPLFHTDGFTISDQAYSGNKALLIGAISPAHPLFSRRLVDYREHSPVIVRISGWYKVATKDSALLLYVKIGTTGKIYSVNNHNLVPGLQKGKWKYAEMAMYLPLIRSDRDSVFISFENRSASPVLLDELKVEFLKMKPTGIMDWILKPEDDVDSVYSFRNSMDQAILAPWMNGSTVSDRNSFSGKNSSGMSASTPYSVGFEKDLKGLFGKKDGYIRVASSVFGNNLSKVTLVFDFSSGGKNGLYKAYPISLPEGEAHWVQNEIFRELPAEMLKADKVKIYYWYNGGTDPVYIDDFQVDLVTYKPVKLPYTNQISGLSDLTVTETFCCNFEQPCLPESGKIIETLYAFSGRMVCLVDNQTPFSYTNLMPVSKAKGGNRYVSISAKFNTDQYKTNAVLVTDFIHNGKSEIYLPYYLRDKTRKGIWNNIQAETAIPEAITDQDSVRVYFYLPESDEVVMIDDLCIKLLSGKSPASLTKYN